MTWNQACLKFVSLFSYLWFDIIGRLSSFSSYSIADVSSGEDEDPRPPLLIRPSRLTDYIQNPPNLVTKGSDQVKASQSIRITPDLGSLTNLLHRAARSPKVGRPLRPPYGVGGRWCRRLWTWRRAETTTKGCHRIFPEMGRTFKTKFWQLESS